MGIICKPTGKMKGHFQKMKYQEEKDKHELRKDTKKEEK